MQSQNTSTDLGVRFYQGVTHTASIAIWDNMFPNNTVPCQHRI